jgi:hypothetical protein
LLREVKINFFKNPAPLSFLMLTATKGLEKPKSSSGKIAGSVEAKRKKKWGNN